MIPDAATPRHEDLARRWTRELPSGFVEQLTVALRSGAGAIAALRAQTVGSASRSACRDAMTVARNGDANYLAGLVDGFVAARLGQPTVTPVWTGPTSTAGATRLTLAVLTDLIVSARQEIVLVSYAAFPGPLLTDALNTAVASGVDVVLILERPTDNPAFNGTDHAFPGLDARRLAWLQTSRPPGASLHAKVLVVDRSVALVGSANLTDRAMEDNLECGLLVRGGSLPSQLAVHLLALSDLRTVE